MSTCSGTAKSVVLIFCIVRKTPLLLVSGAGVSIGFKISSGTWLAADTCCKNQGSPVTIEFTMQDKEQRYSSMHSNYSKPRNRSLNLSSSSEMYVFHWEGRVYLAGYGSVASVPPQASCMCRLRRKAMEWDILVMGGPFRKAS